MKPFKNRNAIRTATAPLLRNGVVAIAFCLMAAAPRSLSAQTADYSRTQQEIARFEMVVNGAVSALFSSSPFAVVQKAKGAYLPDYGVSVSFLVNIHRAVINSPFGQIRSKSGVNPDMKRQRIEELKEKLIRVLQDSGGTLHELRGKERVTIVVYVEDRNFPDEPRGNRTILLSVLKKDLDELGRKGRLNELKQRVKIVEY